MTFILCTLTLAILVLLLILSIQHRQLTAAFALYFFLVMLLKQFSLANWPVKS